MRRLATLLLLVLAGAFAVAGTGAGEADPGNEYEVELDNAFGLIEGGDLKVAGVRAGKITKLTLDRRTKRAIVGFQVTRDGFGSLRSDTTCATRPQSLIGEYFLDCQPGSAPGKLGDGDRIPVERTRVTVGPDLVNTILRRPYKERLAIIVNELGAAVAGNARNLDDAVRRASPALRETNVVLAKLAAQNRTLVRLTEDADTVIGDLDDAREDVGRWVEEAGETAATSATRRRELAEGFRRLPAFLAQLEPTMAALGETADAQTPALRDLRASASRLEELFGRLGPFADASRPAVEALGKASRTGEGSLRAAEPVVTQLRRTARGAPELAKNLAITLEHLDDPANALEIDPRAAKATGRPAPTGYTGLESFLTYAYDQTLSTNIYDQNNHLLKIGVTAMGECAGYADAERAKEVGEECAATLGPNQPGLNFTDTTRSETPAARRSRMPVDPGRGPGLPGARPGR
ncbi:MAG: hypothetical protein JWO90_2169, partial [Solirubrobacterales bacterium]|nr:hypothetical protein [Solirubrobacterales bacterium]